MALVLLLARRDLRHGSHDCRGDNGVDAMVAIEAMG
jgi:hypothetical protein